MDGAPDAPELPADRHPGPSTPHLWTRGL